MANGPLDSGSNRDEWNFEMDVYISTLQPRGNSIPAFFDAFIPRKARFCWSSDVVLRLVVLLSINNDKG